VSLGRNFKTATDILKHCLALDEAMADGAIDKRATWHARERAQPLADGLCSLHI